MFLPDDGRPVFRTRAELDDAYGARQRVKAAIEYNAAILIRFWNVMSRPRERGFFPLSDQRRDA